MLGGCSPEVRDKGLLMEAFNVYAPGADGIMLMGKAPIFLKSYCQSVLEQGIKPLTAPAGDR